MEHNGLHDVAVLPPLLLLAELHPGGHHPAADLQLVQVHGSLPAGLLRLNLLIFTLSFSIVKAEMY